MGTRRERIRDKPAVRREAGVTTINLGGDEAAMRAMAALAG